MRYFLLVFSITFVLMCCICVCIGIAFSPTPTPTTIVVPLRDKTGVRMTLQQDGRWSIPGGLPIVRGTEKVYRNGFRQTAGVDYNLDPINPHFLSIIPSDGPQILLPFNDNGMGPGIVFIWKSTDIVIMDYLY